MAGGVCDILMLRKPLEAVDGKLLGALVIGHASGTACILALYSQKSGYGNLPQQACLPLSYTSPAQLCNIPLLK